MKDERLVERILAGDEEAFGWLLEKYRPRLFRWIVRIVGEASAQDVLQETYIKTHNRLASFRGESSLSTWLHEIARCTALDWREKENRYPLEEIDTDKPGEHVQEALRFDEGDTSIADVLEACPSLMLNPREVDVLPYILDEYPALAFQEIEGVAAKVLTLSRERRGHRFTGRKFSGEYYATRKAIQRLRPKLDLLLILNRCLARDCEPWLLADFVFGTSFYLKDNVIELIVANARRLREEPRIRKVLQPHLEALLTQAVKKLHRYANAADASPSERSRLFSQGYTGLRTVVLLGPEILSQAVGDLTREFQKWGERPELVDRCWSRITALTGDEELIRQHKSYWWECLDDRNDKLLWCASYISMYFHGLPYEASFAGLDGAQYTAIKRLNKLYKGKIRRKVIEEAKINLREDWYKRNPLWAEQNFLRVHLVMKSLGGYGGLNPVEAGYLKRVADHAAAIGEDRRLRSIAHGVSGQLKHQFSLK